MPRELRIGAVEVVAAIAIAIGLLMVVSGVGASVASTAVLPSLSRSGRLPPADNPAVFLLEHAWQIGLLQAVIGLLAVVGGWKLLRRQVWGRALVTTAASCMLAATVWLGYSQARFYAARNDGFGMAFGVAAALQAAVIAAYVGYLFSSHFRRSYDPEAGSPTTR